MKNILLSVSLFMSLNSFGQSGIWQSYSVANSDLADDACVYVNVDEANGDILVSTLNQGLNVMSGTSWTTYNTSTSGIPFNRVSVCLRDGANLWVCTDSGGVSLKTGVNWSVFNTGNSGMSDDRVYAVDKSPNGIMWFGTRDGGLVSYNGTTFSPVSVSSNTNAAENRVHMLAVDANNVVWFGSVGAGLVKYNPSNNTWTQYTTSNSTIPNDDVYAVKIAPDGKVWAGTFGGVAVFDPVGSTFTNIYTTSNSALPANYIRDICFDNAGLAWIATGTGGVAHVNANNSITAYTTGNSNIPSDAVFGIDYGYGRLWIGLLTAGVASMDIDVSVPELQAPELVIEAYSSIASDNVIVSIGTAHDAQVCVGLYSANGQMIWTDAGMLLTANDVKRILIPTAGCASGSYFVVVIDQNGRKHSSQLFIE